MPHRLSIAYFAHSVRSDWNNGNAHFLRGLLHNLGVLGHDVTVYEPRNGWSISNLVSEPTGEQSLIQFDRTYPGLRVVSYDMAQGAGFRGTGLKDTDFVIVHEWNTPELAHRLIDLREDFGFRLLFHDTHHRASSSPSQIRLFKLEHFDGMVVFGEALRKIYRDLFRGKRICTLHEAADTDIFFPRANNTKTEDVVWVGNWGDDERVAEIHEYLLDPASRLSKFKFKVYGVRYPESGLQAMEKAGVQHGGYLPNLDAPDVYSGAKLTLHIPRQQYTQAMAGIPTIRVFEALACGIPLVSAPWSDTEHLFREGDLRIVRNGEEMGSALCDLLSNPGAAAVQAACGLETVRARHTCRHRAEELTSFCEELLH